MGINDDDNYQRQEDSDASDEDTYYKPFINEKFHGRGIYKLFAMFIWNIATLHENI
jgi:hypothetical protein